MADSRVKGFGMIHDILSEKPRIELIQADCMDVMKEMQDKAFSLAVVDPPYGIGIANSSQIGYKGFNIFVAKLWDNNVPDARYFTELNRVSVNRIIWGGNYFNLPPTRCFVIWDKGEGFYNRSYAECEMAWTSFDANARIFKRDPLANGDYKRKVHITQKPVALYRWLLTNYAKQGDTILDTHLGSGSSAIAAWELGFDFLGIELDVDYYAAAKYRIQERMRQPFLPLQEKERMEQRALL